jgi:hypothetical protein
VHKKKENIKKFCSLNKSPKKKNYKTHCINFNNIIIPTNF